ncbi:Nascent polypeptide-associated complex subunit beta [Salinomyces thailandicus]|uniref:Nascent polypeptide-associated complex subunit beta n=1 Tax=Salinomyces thailandicus TaxID=706561 RepID=A0A4U0TZL2_9PEZI|nr:Nascent polypeptide-associated complex subunit beta [Salinomyces thailandica]
MPRTGPPEAVPTGAATSIVKMDHEKLARMQNAVRIGMFSLVSIHLLQAPQGPVPLRLPASTGNMAGKGTPRRKMKKVHKSSGTDDKKLQTTLKKLNVQPITAIEEVNMFKSDGNVIHFSAPKVHASVPSNTFALYGNGEDKELTELVPGILNQLGPDSLASLRKLAESYQSMQKGGEGEEGKKEGGDDDDEIPDLVEGSNFETKGDVE